MAELVGKVAVVTGSSRGAGRGIALTLGEAGATVYVTGRSAHGRGITPNRAETVDETAEMVTVRGGEGIAVYCDHSIDRDIEWLFERVKRGSGRLDILVNNAWGGYENYVSNKSFDAPFWEQPLDRFDRMLNVGLRSHLVTSRHSLPLMMARGRGLIVNTTVYVESCNWDLDAPLGGNSVFYDTVKTAINRLTFGMAHDLRAAGTEIAVLALAPGFMRTESVLRHFNTDADHWQEVDGLQDTETPEYSGRAILALASDPAIMDKTGRLLTAGELAREYGFTDIDGRQPQFYETLAGA